MRCGTGRRARLARSLGVGAVLTCALLAATASSALAWGDGDRDSYTVNITPASAPAGQATTFDVALTNSSPGSGLASAAITPPLGFKVTGASLPADVAGHVHVILGIVVLDHLNVSPDSTLHVSVTAKAPSRCRWPFSRWFTVANEGGPLLRGPPAGQREQQPDHPGHVRHRRRAQVRHAAERHAGRPGDHRHRLRHLGAEGEGRARRCERQPGQYLGNGGDDCARQHPRGAGRSSAERRPSRPSTGWSRSTT